MSASWPRSAWQVRAPPAACLPPCRSRCGPPYPVPLCCPFRPTRCALTSLLPRCACLPLLLHVQAEDHLFGDKEKFVTAAYRAKLAERQAWQEEQKRKWVAPPRRRPAPRCFRRLASPVAAARGSRLCPPVRWSHVRQAACGPQVHAQPAAHNRRPRRVPCRPLCAGRRRRRRMRWRSGVTWATSTATCCAQTWPLAARRRQTARRRRRLRRLRRRGANSGSPGLGGLLRLPSRRARASGEPWSQGRRSASRRRRWRRRRRSSGPSVGLPPRQRRRQQSSSSSRRALLLCLPARRRAGARQQKRVCRLQGLALPRRPRQRRKPFSGGTRMMLWRRRGSVTWRASARRRAEAGLLLCGGVRRRGTRRMHDFMVSPPLPFVTCTEAHCMQTVEVQSRVKAGWQLELTPLELWCPARPHEQAPRPAL